MVNLGSLGYHISHYHTITRQMVIRNVKTRSAKRASLTGIIDTDVLARAGKFN